MTRGGHLDVRSCNHLLTGIGCAGRIYTDPAVFDVLPTGLKLVDLCDGFGLAELQHAHQHADRCMSRSARAGPHHDPRCRRRASGSVGDVAFAVDAAGAGAPPRRIAPFEAVRARLWWLDESPERLHHKKESELLPAAASSSAADWVELDVAVAANRDPLTGHEPDSSQRSLSSTIVRMTPAPIGLDPTS